MPDLNPKPLDLMVSPITTTLGTRSPAQMYLQFFYLVHFQFGIGQRGTKSSYAKKAANGSVIDHLNLYGKCLDSNMKRKEAFFVRDSLDFRPIVAWQLKINRNFKSL